MITVISLYFRFIDLLIGLDESHEYPAALIEQQYSYYFHIFIIFSLLLAIYGLGGIYHSAEEQLQHHHIFYKFAIYKVFVTVVKTQELLVTYTTDNMGEQMESLASGAFSGHIRVHLWLYFLIIFEALIVFPFVIKAYSTKDYPKHIVQIKLDNEDIFPEEEEGSDDKESGGYTSFPLSDCKYLEDCENGEDTFELNLEDASLVLKPDTKV